MRKSVKASGTQRADYLEGDSQNRIKPHRAVFCDPRVRRLALQIFRDEDEVIVFDSESIDFCDVDVIEQLGGTRLLHEPFPRHRIHARDRNELQGHWFTGSDVFGLVDNRAARSAEFSRETIAFRAEAVVLGKSCPFHKSRRGPGNAGSESFTSIQAAASAASPRRDGYPAWIRTKNNASKGRCVTVTPRGKEILDFQSAIADLQSSI